MSTTGIVEQEHFAHIAEDILNKGKCLRFQATGSSMYPSIRNGQIITVQPIPFSELKVGEIVFFKSGENSFVAHRYISKKPGGAILAKGDANSGLDEEVKPEQVLGRVISIDSDGRQIALDTQRKKISGWIIAKYSLIRIVSFKIFLKARSIAFKTIKPVLLKLQNTKKYRSLSKNYSGKVDYKIATAEDERRLSTFYRHAGNIRNFDAEKISLILSEGEKSSYFRVIAKKNRQLVGIVTAIKSKQKNKSKEYPGAWWLMGLVVRSRYRGMGIGEGLLKEAIKKIGERNGDVVKTLTAKDNKPAKALYKKIGFVETTGVEQDCCEWIRYRIENENQLVYSFVSNQKLIEQVC